MALEYPDDLKYLDSHEYVRLEGEIATIGISTYAVQQLGDIVFVELPEVDDALEKGETFGSIESVKAVEDIYAPISGTVVEVNSDLEDSPEKIDKDPYGEGWLLKVRVNNPEEDLAEAMTADEYREKVKGE